MPVSYYHQGVRTDRPCIRAPRRRVPVIVLLCAVFVFAATNLMSYFFFEHIPHIHDEMGYLFQAKMFSGGEAFVPSPTPREAFDFPHVVNNGKWYSQYPPGFPFLMILGLILGMPWIINPLLAALAAVVLYILGKEIYGEPEGRLAAVLCSLSIWFLLISSTMLSHTSSMLLYALFLLFSFRSMNSPSFRNGLWAGLSLGMALLIRPFNVGLIAAPMLVAIGVRGGPASPRKARSLAGLALAILAAVACLLAYNQITNGNPMKMGYTVKYGDSHGLGFGRSGYMGVPHTPERAFYLLGENMAAINKYLFGWPLSSLVFLVPFLIPMKDEKKKREADFLLAMSFLTLAAGLFFYWGNLVFLGARMFFEAFPVLILMTARGITKTVEVLSRSSRSWGPQSVKWALRGLLAIFTLFAFSYTFPHWVHPAQTDDFDRVMVKDFNGVSPKIDRSIRQLPLGRSLVILKLMYTPKPYFPDSWWGSGFLYNDPRLRNEIIYAQDRGAANLELMYSFPDRKVYLYVGCLDRGVLMPFEVTEGRLRYGDPIPFEAPGEKTARLVKTPAEIFLFYSEAFRAHIETICRAHPPNGIDVISLTRMAREDEAAGRIQPALFDIEAALQIENDTAVRSLLLNSLARLYLRMGNAERAGQIKARLADPFFPRVYNVCPERGY